MLYPLVQAWKDEPNVLKWVLAARPRWGLKTLHLRRDCLVAVRQENPECRIWYRRYMSPADQAERLRQIMAAAAGTPPEDLRARLAELTQPFAREFRDSLLADLENNRCRDLVNVIQGLNETGLYELAPAYAAFEVVFTSLMHAEGLEVASYSFSVGQPDDMAKYWPEYLPIPGDYLSLHQYHQPALDAPGEEWYLTRHTKVRQMTGYTGPIVLGETGIDFGGQFSDGWRRSGIAVEEYCRQLKWAARRFYETKVAAAFLFVAGGWGWYNFEVADEPKIAETLAEIVEEYGRPWGPDPGPTTEAATGPAPQLAEDPGFRLGFRSYVAEHPMIAASLEGERPDFAGNAYQRFAYTNGKRGLLRWDHDANAIEEYEVVGGWGKVS